MANIIKIKSGATVPTTDILTEQELGFCELDNKLYINTNGVIVPVSGSDYTGGTGITVVDKVINHSNSIEVPEETEPRLYPLTFDSEGHITSIGTGLDSEDLKTKFYSLVFSADDEKWTASGTSYSITIPAETHLCGTDIIVDVYFLNGELFRKAWAYFTAAAWYVDVDTSGNVVLTTDSCFAGKIVIK